MPASVSRLPVKPRSLPNGAFQSVVTDIMSIEGLEVEHFAIVVWYKGGAVLKYIPAEALARLGQCIADEKHGGEYGDGA